MMNQIKVFKTIAGDDLIGEIVNTDNNWYEVEKLAQLIIQETEGGMRVGLAPIMPYAVDKVKMYISGILAESDPDPSMIKEYKRVFSPIIQSSGLVMPK